MKSLFVTIFLLIPIIASASGSIIGWLVILSPYIFPFVLVLTFVSFYVAKLFVKKGFSSILASLVSSILSYSVFTLVVNYIPLPVFHKTELDEFRFMIAWYLVVMIVIAIVWTLARKRFSGKPQNVLFLLTTILLSLLVWLHVLLPSWY